MDTALVLSGGGSKGAFQLGALETLQEQGYTYNSIAGVSVGALNGALISAGELDRLGEIWRTITEEQVYRKRSLVELASAYLLYKIGLRKPPLAVYSNKPLAKLIEKEIKGLEFDLPLKIGRVELQSGKYISTINPGSPDFGKQLLASSAIPVIWDPVKIDGKFVVDGGIRNITPLKEIILQDPDQIIVITTEPRDKPPQKEKIKDIFDIAKRAIGIMLDEIFDEDIERCLQINELVRQAEQKGVELKSRSGRVLKYIDITLIEPSETLGSGLDFGRKRLDRLIEKGKEAARKAVSPIA